MMEPAFTGSKENADDLNRDVAAMVKEIAKIGPRVPEIARRMGRHKETVRYWYKKLEQHDFAVQAITNHEAFGLRRIILKVKFGEDYEDYVRPLMLAMNQLSYVVGYTKMLGDDRFTIMCSVPEEVVHEYDLLIADLKQMGVFVEVEWYDLGWFRNIPMKGEFYDFATGRWGFDLKDLTQRTVVSEPPTINGKAKFDKIDLLIVKELAYDATRELQDIQRAIREKDGVDVNYKTLCWHLKEHVMAKGLVKGFRINWMGTRWDSVTERSKHRSHTYVGIHFLVKGPTDAERSQLIRSFERLPVVWSEGAGHDYFAELAVPTEMIIECMDYLGSVMAPVRDKATCHIMDQRNAGSFWMSYQLFDEESKNWKFNREELMVKFRALEVQVKQGH